MQQALDHVSISLRDSEFVAILGPSGSGKTTLLNVIGGLDRYDSGDLIINGVSTNEYTDRDWDSYRNHSVGFVFQSYNLIEHQTVLSNVELALTISGITGSERRRRAADALERVGLGAHLNKKPNQLSGGQMQRVAIARALVNNPEILLADEPTGALDSDTSLQVMELLKEVSKDRLIVMVTHNPDLAYQYATRIVNLRDGRITDDSDPYEPEPAAEPPQHRNFGRAAMNFGTALSLSFNNLRTKKARTLLVAFAGSIGIIGIALVMALQGGVMGYIDDSEKVALSKYPIELDKTSYDVSSTIDEISGEGEESRKETEDKVHVRKLVSSYLSDASFNDLASFKTFIDSGKSGIEKHADAIEYNYNITPQIYQVSGDQYRQVNPDQILSSMGMGSSTTNSGSMISMMDVNVFSAMPQDEELYRDQYDVKAGRWPKKANELVLVLTQDSAVSDLVLYDMGVKDPEQLDSYIDAYINQRNFTVDDDDETYDYEDFLGITFKMVSSADYYTYDEEHDLWISQKDDEEYMRSLVENGEDLTIVGVVQPKKNSTAAMLGSGIKYSYDLNLEAIQQAKNKDAVQAQLSQPDRNIFTGKSFGSGDEDINFADLFTINQDALADAFSLNADSIDTSALTDAFGSIDLSGLNLGDLLSAQDLSAAMPSMSSEEIADLLSQIEVNISQEDLQTLSENVMNGYLAYAAADPSTDYQNLPTAVSEYLRSSDAQSIVRTQLQQIISENADKLITQEQLQQMMEQFLAGFKDYADENGMTDPSQMGEYMTQYLQSPQAQALLAADLSEIESSIQNMQISDEQAQALASALADGYTAYAQANGKPDLTKIGSSFTAYLNTQEGQQLITDTIASAVNTDRLQQQMQDMISQTMSGLASDIGSQLQSAMTSAMSELGTQITAQMESAVSSMTGSFADLFDMDPSALSSLISTNLSAAQIRSLLQQILSGSDEDSLENNLAKLDYADVGDPYQILIYPKNFDAKSDILQIIADYNEDAEKAGEPDKKISYSDMVGVLMDSLSTIVNTISKVIIAFVAISLVVSSIMIGVITYISVLERRKEIGILRAIGASKHNVSEIFNAETFIIGLLSGFMGVGITYALLPLVNVIIRHVADVENISAFLSYPRALKLIVLSVILSCVSGLWPASKAAKSDPVAALRSE